MINLLERFRGWVFSHKRLERKWGHLQSTSLVLTMYATGLLVHAYYQKISEINEEEHIFYPFIPKSTMLVYEAKIVKKCSNVLLWLNNFRFSKEVREELKENKKQLRLESERRESN